jgi:hypothetical protein
VDVKGGQGGSKSELGKPADLFELARERIEDVVLVEEVAVLATLRLQDETTAVAVPPPLA